MQGAGVSWSPGSDQAERTQLRAKWVSVSSSAALHGPQPPGNEECEHWDITAPGHGQGPASAMNTLHTPHYSSYNLNCCSLSNTDSVYLK